MRLFIQTSQAVLTAKSPGATNQRRRAGVVRYGLRWDRVTGGPCNRLKSSFHESQPLCFTLFCPDTEHDGLAPRSARRLILLGHATDAARLEGGIHIQTEELFTVSLPSAGLPWRQQIDDISMLRPPLLSQPTLQQQQHCPHVTAGSADAAHPLIQSYSKKKSSGSSTGALSPSQAHSSYTSLDQGTRQPARSGHTRRRGAATYTVSPELPQT